jgi:hypothetical protein
MIICTFSKGILLDTCKVQRVIAVLSSRAQERSDRDLREIVLPKYDGGGEKSGGGEEELYWQVAKEGETFVTNLRLRLSHTKKAFPLDDAQLALGSHGRRSHRIENFENQSVAQVTGVHPQRFAGTGAGGGEEKNVISSSSSRSSSSSSSVALPQ